MQKHLKKVIIGKSSAICYRNKITKSQVMCMLKTFMRIKIFKSLRTVSAISMTFYSSLADLLRK